MTSLVFDPHVEFGLRALRILRRSNLSLAYRLHIEWRVRRSSTDVGRGDGQGRNLAV